MSPAAFFNGGGGTKSTDYVGYCRNVFIFNTGANYLHYQTISTDNIKSRKRAVCPSLHEIHSLCYGYLYAS